MKNKIFICKKKNSKIEQQRNINSKHINTVVTLHCHTKHTFLDVLQILRRYFVHLHDFLFDLNSINRDEPF